jgi:hypothetical protein
VLEILIRPRPVPVDRYGEASDAEFRHESGGPR